MEKADNTGFLTTRDAASYLGLTQNTLRIMRVRGDGPPYHRIGKPLTGHVVYSKADLDAFVGRAFSNTSEETVTAERVVG